MKAAVPTLDSRSPVDKSSWKSLMVVDVYVAISANLARSAALLRCRPVVEAGISNWGGKKASRVALSTCLAMMFSILV